jgi:hypothetical protein
MFQIQVPLSLSPTPTPNARSASISRRLGLAAYREIALAAKGPERGGFLSGVPVMASIASRAMCF